MAHHNPRGGNLLWWVGGAAGGWLLTGSVASMLAPSGWMNYLAQGGVALGGGYLIGRWKKPLGVGFTIGGLASLAIKLYQDFTSGGAGVSYYAQSSFPVPTSTPSGSPFNWPAFSPGGASTLPVGTSPAAAATISATGGKYTQRLAGRFSH